MALLVLFIPYELNGFYNVHLVECPAAYWCVELFTWVVMPCVVFWWLLRQKSVTLADVGLKAPRSVREWLWLVLICVVAGPVLYSIDREVHAMACGAFPRNYLAAPFSYKDTIPKVGILSYLVLIYHSCSAGIVEEVFYRGVFRRLFDEGALQVVLYVLLSSVVFSSVHWEGGIHRMIASFVFGYICAVFFVCYRNILPLIVAHCYVDIMWFR